jgi:hypothetical protein
VGVTAVLAVGAVLLHYESSIALTRVIAHSHMRRQRRILILIFGMMLAHIIEIWLFGMVAYWVVEQWQIGTIRGYESMEFLDYIYLSAITFTTAGYGDIVPVGPIRFLFGTESLTGFMLITWSASLTFLEMQTYWKMPKHD